MSAIGPTGMPSRPNDIASEQADVRRGERLAPNLWNTHASKSRGLARPLRFGISLRCKNRWDRWRSRWRRGGAFVFFPRFLGKSGLPTHRHVFVPIGDLGHHRACDAGFGLRHKPLQFRAAVGEVLALGLELLAVVQFVFGGIGEGRSSCCRSSRRSRSARRQSQAAPAAVAARSRLARGTRTFIRPSVSGQC